MIEEKHGGIFGLGLPNDAFAKYFTGKSYIKKLTKDEVFMPMSNVTFEPGCRNNWHIHNSKFPVGQMLICVDGEGWYQEFGKEAVKLSLGMVVEIPANAKHWHGAAKDSWFSHIAFSIPDTTASTKWCEKVSDDEYKHFKLIRNKKIPEKILRDCFL